MVYIPPFQLLDHFAGRKFQLMLPQLTKNRTYSNFMRRVAVSERSQIILDNGANEGVDISNAELIATAWNYNVNEIVLPDIMGNYEATYDRGVDFILNYKRRLPVGARTGMVLHGKNAADAIHNYRTLSTSAFFHEIDVIYIPRMLVQPNDRLARIKVATAILESHRLPKPIHFLGASVHLLDEGRHIKQFLARRIRSMDTSAPFVYAMKGVAVDDTEETISRDHETYFTAAIDDGTARLASYNCGIMDWWIDAKAPISEV